MKYTYEPAKKQLDEYLKEHGLKQTNERSEILKLICTYARPFTAKQVQNDISSVLAVSVATIYNTLRLFQNANLVSISRRQKEEQSAEADRYNKNTERQVYYEVALGSKNTMIFICSRCGKEQEFKSKILENSIEAQHIPNYVQHRFSLVLYGTCKKCRRIIAKSIEN